MTTAFVLIASDCRFSRAVLGGLLARDCPPRALLLHAPVAPGKPFCSGIKVEVCTHSELIGRTLPVADTHTAAGLATAAGIPVERVADARALAARLAAPSPALGLVACWPGRLPDAVLARPDRGLLNLHPSLLPQWRGPAPIFWQLHGGATETGITLHRVTAVLDAGPVVAQVRQPLDAGAREGDLEIGLADLGAEVFSRSLAPLAAGPAPGARQDDSHASRQGWPAERDFRIQIAWTAERAYRFMTGVVERGRPFELVLPGGRLLLDRALGYEPDPGGAGSPGTVTAEEDGTLRVGLRGGVLRTRPARR